MTIDTKLIIKQNYNDLDSISQLWYLALNGDIYEEQILTTIDEEAIEVEGGTYYKLKENVKSLLDNPDIDINAQQDSTKGTLLHLVANSIIGTKMHTKFPGNPKHTTAVEKWRKNEKLWDEHDESADFFKLILNHPKCDVNIQDAKGDTVAHILAKYASGKNMVALPVEYCYTLADKLLNILLDYGIDPTVKNHHDKTFIDYTLVSGNIDTNKAILKYSGTYSTQTAAVVLEKQDFNVVKIDDDIVQVTRFFPSLFEKCLLSYKIKNHQKFIHLDIDNILNNSCLPVGTKESVVKEQIHKTYEQYANYRIKENLSVKDENMPDKLQNNEEADAIMDCPINMVNDTVNTYDPITCMGEDIDSPPNI